MGLSLKSVLVFRSALPNIELVLVSNSFKRFHRWALIFLAANGLLAMMMLLVLLKNLDFSPGSQANASTTRAIATPSTPTATPQLGPRHQLTYQQWVDLLTQEAKVTAQNKPPHLTVLLGDSLSLWFPTDLLSSDRQWLNQGISGETTAGLLRRVDLLDPTEPETIFLMIGINDLIRGVSDETILANQREIIQHLKQVHPRAQIVVQSILPHAAEQSTWEGRDRLLEIPNSRIRRINERLNIIADKEEVYYLDLYSLFANDQGNLMLTLTTDGLHLNEQGYLVWRTALNLYSQIELAQAR